MSDAADRPAGRDFGSSETVDTTRPSHRVNRTSHLAETMADRPPLFDRLRRPFTENVVDTRKAGAYPEIGPRTYRAPVEDVYAAIRELVAAHDRWEIVEEEDEERRLAFEATTPLMGFVDDVTVEVEGDEGTSVVHIRSASRVGEGDLGKNASRVREFFALLDQQI